jgi:hypothetical protein
MSDNNKRRRRPSAKKLAASPQRKSPLRKSPLPLRQLAQRRKQARPIDDWDLDSAVAFVEGRVAGNHVIAVDKQPKVALRFIS